MRLTLVWTGWALCLCASLAVSAQDYAEDGEMILELIREDGSQPETGAEPAAELLRCNKAAWRMPGQYLVILRQGTHESQVQRTIRRLRAKAARRGDLVEILQTYSGALRGFLVKMSNDVLGLAMKLPHVHYIEEDSSIFAQSAPWNLQRLLQPHGHICENGTYRPPNDGRMVEVYLMDGSVQNSHREVEGRVLITDFNNVPDEDGVRVHRQASQCDSHATHVAGVVSGSDSGVARGAGINLVRVLNCQGKGTMSGALAGIEYVRATLLARPVDAVVVLLPFIGGFSRSLNTACRDLVANRAVVVAAAGNFRDDACLYSPASEPELITVGAVNSADQLMSQGAGGTNFGRCVDLFAPGDDIVSASSDCSTCFTSRSGTSQAAAHVAGIAAVMLSSSQNMSPVQVLQMMLHYSISNTINLLSLSETHQLTTPNLVAAMPPENNSDGELLCRSVWSERSGVASIDRAISRCRQGEEMMGCSSYAPDGVRVGETIRMNSGQMECVAHNGPGGKGVYAVARCCMIGGLQCVVHVSSDPGQDAECVDPQHHLTGCTSWSPTETLSDSRPHHGNQKRCIVTDGATSHAVCCHAPSLQCHLLENVSADKDQAELSCPSGWSLTDCSAVSQGSAILGPVAKGNSCRVRSAPGAHGAAGIAVCCRVRLPEKPSTTPH
ncbi:proprotein convertase subtilisin/kexin type 9 [Mastacembelus armatus]|uniref:proprotein convertase subtilisin/kexin type 9 n=1 Tax=Mastacembelus armatus TaxID=205130 RepID=UPI000E4656DE|nr:proprotein convertase subtilisin/kexin type 9 [Mastacembelus armatus]XP_026161364.1 proprotein convertase subtilisin/kexin type 9 [Mastacembelus armatus]